MSKSDVLHSTLGVERGAFGVCFLHVYCSIASSFSGQI